MRARARASLALGSALASAIVTSALLLSGSVRALRGASAACFERGDTPVVAESALHEAPTVQRELAGDVTRRPSAPRFVAALAGRAEPACARASLGANPAYSVVSRSHGADIARGYDATAPPHQRV